MEWWHIILIIAIIFGIVGIYIIKKAEMLKGEEKVENITMNVSPEDLATIAAEEILENVTTENLTPEEISDYLG